MNVSQVYKTTLAIMSENESNASSYTEFVIPNINIILSELFDIENSIRSEVSVDLLNAIPVVSAMDEEIPYSEQLCRTVLPYGLAVYLAMGDDEYSKAGFYDSRYQMAKAKYARANYVKVNDFYGNDYYE